MATLYLTEFNAIGGNSNFNVPGGQWPAVAEQTVTIGGASALSSAFNAATTYIRVHVDSICSIEIGANPVATTSKARMAANQTEYWPVRAGDFLAVITNT